jgi:SAM-dependent methyltransferase
MQDEIASFYSPLAEHYHLIFEDWDESINRQARVLNPLLSAEMRDGSLKILDCACGIGTQSLGFAAQGHQVVASDISPGAIARAKREGEVRSRRISFHILNMTSLVEIQDADFDVVTALDNALPHLTPEELPLALRAIASKLLPNGLFLASTRDYDTLMLQRPTVQPPAFYGAEGDRRIVHQIWDWVDDRRYTLHLYITQGSGVTWESHHFVSEYRCLLREELAGALEAAGFEKVRWLMPAESGYYQPIVLARRR